MQRLVQIGYVLLAAGLTFAVCVTVASPGTLAIVIGAIVLLAIIVILIRPASQDSWEEFWEKLFGWMWWW